MQASDPTNIGLNTENNFWWFFKLIYPFNEMFDSTSIRVLSLLTTSFIFYFVFYKLCHNILCVKLKIYLIKSSENTHIWDQFVAKILVWNIRQRSCLKGIQCRLDKHKDTFYLPNRISNNSKTLIDNIFCNIPNSLVTNAMSGNISSSISDQLPQFFYTTRILFKFPSK